MLQLSIEHVVTHPLILDAAEHLVLCTVSESELQYCIEIEHDWNIQYYLTKRPTENKSESKFTTFSTGRHGCKR